MQSRRYLQHIFRAVAVACMLYALTLIADTARASTLVMPASELASHPSRPDNSR